MRASTTLARLALCAVVALAALALAGLWLATAAGRIAVTPPAWLVVVVMTLPLVYGVLTLASLAAAWLASCRGHRRSAVILGAVAAAAVVTMLVLWAWSWLPHGSDNPGETLSVVTWNVGRLGALADDRLRAQAEALECVTEALTEVAPDALALLEVSGPRLDALSARLGLDCVRTDYYGTGRHTAGGLAVCVPRSSPWQLARQRSLDLPPNWKYVFTELRRDRLAVNMLAVHFIPYGVHERLLPNLVRRPRHTLAESLDRIERIADLQAQQARRLTELTATFHDPTVIAGDFNGTRDFRAHALLRRTMHDAWAEGGLGLGATRRLWGWLPLRIDHVYASSDAFTVVDAALLPTTCGSDHRGIVARLSINETGGPS